MQDNESIGVVYLLRQAEGLEAPRHFIDSYRRYPAGLQHSLIVLYKGFAERTALEEAKAVFRGTPHLGLELEDRGFDIGSYLDTSRRLSHDYLLFLNIHSEIVAPGWLLVIADHATKSGVGIAGAMGSYESILDSTELIQRVIWMRIDGLREYDPRAHEYFRFVFDEYYREQLPPVRPEGPDISIAGRRLWRLRDEHYHRRWLELLRPGQPFAEYAQFPPFPNPHIRSNAFMVRRERVLGFDPMAIRTKLDACAFESGTDGLTARLRREGLATVVVGRDGSAHDVADWPKSDTFRLGEQANLLISDNQSRAFMHMSPGVREVHVRMTWGDDLAPARVPYPDVGINFALAPMTP